MTDLEVLEKYQKEYEINDCFDNKYEWASSHVFNLATYDGTLDEMFVKKIIEVCKVILEKRNFEYIKDESNYISYILVSQLLDHLNWIGWGTSIRGAWFEEDVRYGACRTTPILDMNEYVPYSKKNLELLIKFLEE